MKKLKLRTKQYPHQRKAMIRAVKQGSHAFFFEPRLGKSKAALDAIAVQHTRGVVKRVVIIAPLIALDVWVGQICEHLSVPARVKVIGEPPIFYWPTVRQSKKKPIKLTIYLINYDKFSRRGDEETYRNDYLRRVERWDPDLFVLDESHRVKRAGAVRSQALWRSIRRLRAEKSNGRPYVFLLTGTPNPKGYIDIFSQFRILDDSIFGTNKADFEENYCIFGHGTRKYTIIRYRHKAEILRKVRERATITTAKQAGLAGKQFFNPIYVKLPTKVRLAYEQLATEFLTEIEGQVLDAANAGVRRMRLLQITGGFTTDGGLLHRVKLEAAQDWLSDLREQGESVVVYARFLAEVHALTELCEHLKYPTRTITGQVKRKDRSLYISEFQQSKKPRALVFQADAGALSIELSRAAEQVFYSLPDSWSTYYQCLERVRGPNQHRPVRYTNILARGTADLSVLDALRNKRDMHAELMKSPRSFLFGL